MLKPTRSHDNPDLYPLLSTTLANESISDLQRPFGDDKAIWRRGGKREARSVLLRVLQKAKAVAGMHDSHRRRRAVLNLDMLDLKVSISEANFPRLQGWK